MQGAEQVRVLAAVEDRAGTATSKDFHGQRGKRTLHLEREDNDGDGCLKCSGTVDLPVFHALQENAHHSDLQIPKATWLTPMAVVDALAVVRMNISYTQDQSVKH